MFLFPAADTTLMEIVGLVAHVALAGSVTVDVLLKKSDVRAALGWIALAWFSPILGALLYPAFQAIRTRWWVSGLRLDAVTARSHLRTWAMYGVYLRFAGLALLFLLALGLAAIPFAMLYGKLLGNGPNLWVRMQATYDTWHATREVDVSKIPTLKPAA